MGRAVEGSPLGLEIVPTVIVPQKGGAIRSPSGDAAYIALRASRNSSTPSSNSFAPNDKDPTRPIAIAIAIGFRWIGTESGHALRRVGTLSPKQTERLRVADFELRLR